MHYLADQIDLLETLNFYKNVTNALASGIKILLTCRYSNFNEEFYIAQSKTTVVIKLRAMYCNLFM